MVGVLKAVIQTHRLIWGVQRSNLFFWKYYSAVDHPRSYLLPIRYISTGSKLYRSGCDIYQFYNRLRVPKFMITFLVFPRVRAQKLNSNIPARYFVHCLHCVSMGATFYVSLAQADTKISMRRTRLHRLTYYENFPYTVIQHGVATKISRLDGFNSISK